MGFPAIPLFLRQYLRNKLILPSISSSILQKNSCRRRRFHTLNLCHIPNAAQTYFYKSQGFQFLNVCGRNYSVNPILKDAVEFRNEHNITVVGEDVPEPYTSVDNSEFPDYIKDYLQKKNFTKPTIIQAQGWPIAMSGRNLVGIAQTGTGKTLAYLLPAIVHIKEKATRKGLGPIVLILAPTRELARQIEQVANDFRYLLNIKCACIYGGASRGRQAGQLERGVDLVIATPGRLNDFLRAKDTNMHRCTYVVLDEADRMLDMGFEPQIREIMEEVPLERQILMWSATWPKEVQSLAKDYLGEYVQVNVGSTELSANHNIEQKFHICEKTEKLERLKSIMHNISGDGLHKMLIFTNTKIFVDRLTQILRKNAWRVDGIHGDRTQIQRDSIIQRFKTDKANVLVATDVAARGLDVDGITHVINFDFPSCSEDYIHRIGRTGRSENKGVSHTLLTDEDAKHAASLIEVLKEANQNVPQDLIDLANSYKLGKQKDRQEKMHLQKYNRFKKTNFKSRWDRHSDGHSDRYSDGHSDRYSDGHSDRYSNRYSDGHSDRYSNRYSDGHSDRYSDRYSDKY